MHIAAHPYLSVPSPMASMVASSWEFFAVKLISVPIFIWVVSTVARKWGHSIGGLILGLPLTSGPVLLFLSLEQGNAFASEAAIGALMGLVPLAASCLVFSLLSFKVGWPASLVACCLAYFVVAFILNYVSVPALWLFVGVPALLVTTRSLFPSGSVETVSHTPPTWEIPARAIAATALVLLITEGATLLGSHLSGLLTPFPVYTTVVGVFTLKFDGASACAIFLRGVITGCFTTVVFLFLISSFIIQFGLVSVMGLAILAALLIHSLLLYAFGRERWHVRN
jgi:hypothetical protein